jgi:peptidoglycan/LPS O-acetylase OafA/YrhL
LRRIYPAFWIYLAIVSAVLLAFDAVGHGTLFEDEHHPIALPTSLTASQWLGNLTLTETWRPYLFGDPGRFLVGHAWTLCYEEQFYAIAGLLLVLAPRRWFEGVGVVTLGVVLYFFARKLRPDLPYAGFFFDGSWLLFAAGAAVFGALASPAARLRRVWTVTLAALTVGFAALASARPAWTATGIDYAVGMGFAAALLILAPWEARIAASPSLKPLNWCGVRCYSLYLIHWPIAKGVSHAAALAGWDAPAPTFLITLPIVLALSLAATAVFHRNVEARFFAPTPAPRPGVAPIATASASA